ncbi:MAG TPA: GNAT family N-acetyltransferase, partial [Chloroflexota bacterium]|nr:GNAT family N-acetyltransferase [Chloroflexota bacterium]
MPETTEHTFELDLKDGRRVRVRPIRPEDEMMLQAAFSRLSERSVYFRFRDLLPSLPEEMAKRLVTVDMQERAAIVAVEGVGEAERILGVARYDAPAGTAVADLIVIVVDEYQRLGLGSALLSLIGRIAREHGIDSFQGEVAADNGPALRMLRSMNLIQGASLEGDLYRIKVGL